MEERALQRRTASERLSDIVALHAGRVWFIVGQALATVSWIAWNSGLAPGLKQFDPFPHPILSMLVVFETIFLTLILIMSQNRATRQADERAHLHLQINLLAEHETTKVLSLLQAICTHHRLPEGKDPELTELLQPIEPADLAYELGQRLPANAANPFPKTVP